MFSKKIKTKCNNSNTKKKTAAKPFKWCMAVLFHNSIFLRSNLLCSIFLANVLILCPLQKTGKPNPTGNYMFKVNNKNSRRRCEICSELTTKTPERRHWRFVNFVNFEQENAVWVWFSSFGIFTGSIKWEHWPEMG